MTEKIKEKFRSIYGEEPEYCWFAPGRVNLIGEHTDYNGGYVLPCAIKKGIYCAAKKRGDDRVRLYSSSFPDDGIIEVTFGGLLEMDKNSWSSYPLGMFLMVLRQAYHISGLDLFYDSDLPEGAGLSSSAAIEVVTIALIADVFELPIAKCEMALSGQYVENEIIGVSCGIMDQYTVAFGKKDRALLLNTRRLEHEYYRIPKDVSFIAVNSGVKHSLASSAYNERRAQCNTALNDLNRQRYIPALCTLDVKEFEAMRSQIKDQVCRKRAHHAIYENQRVKESASALIDNKPEKFGRYMLESHISLRDDYEVSCEELDFLVDTAMGIEGVYGARMTGGGFGGCTINLVRKDAADSFRSAIREAYSKAYGIDPMIIDVEPGDGVRRIF